MTLCTSSVNAATQCTATFKAIELSPTSKRSIIPNLEMRKMILIIN